VGSGQDISWKASEQAQHIGQSEGVSPQAHLLQREKKDIVYDDVRYFCTPVFFHIVFETFSPE
jgi:hypothetical protein